MPKKNFLPKPINEIKLIPEFSSYQQYILAILIGGMLGDFSISRSNLSPNTRKAALWIAQSKDKHSEYLYHLFDIFKNNNLLSSSTIAPSILETPANQMISRSIKKLYFVTPRTSEYYILYEKFYSEEGPKVVPKTIRQDLTPIALAYWYMDDGSIKDRKNRLSFILNTLSFTIYEVFLLCDVLWRKFNILCWPNQQKEDDVTRLREWGIDPDSIFDTRNRTYWIFISGHSFETMSDTIKRYLVQEMLDSKWPFPQEERKQLQTTFKNVNLGRYVRTIEKQSRKVIITEKILNFDLTKSEWETNFTIEKNNFDLYLEAYKKSPPLNKHPIFKYWD